MTARRLIALVVLLLGVSAAERPALAESPSLQNGVAHYQGGRLEEAARAFDAVLEDGRATRADLTEAYRHLAILHLIRGQRPDAERAALHAVTLDRATTPPEGSPAEAAAVFDAARARVPAGGLEGSLELPARPYASSPVGARVRIVGDAAGLVTATALTCRGEEVRGNPQPAPDGSSVVQLVIDSGAAGRRTDCRMTLLTSANVVVAEATASFVARASPSETTPTGTEPVPTHAERDGDGRGFPWIWVGVGAVVVAAAIVGVILLTSDPDEDAFLGPPEVLDQNR